MTRPRSVLHRAVAVTAGTALGLLGAVALASPASAADFLDVDTEAELVTAITTAAPGDTIHLTGTGFALTADLPPIEEGVSIVGPGSDSFTIDGDGHEVFDLVGDALNRPAVGISGIRIADAPVTVRSDDVDLVLDDVSLTTTGLDFLEGDLTVTNSDFSSTTGVGADVGVTGDMVIDIENSTFDDNAHIGLELSVWGTSQASLVGLSSTGSATGFSLYLGNDGNATATGLTVEDGSSNGIDIHTRVRSTVTLTEATATGNDGNGLLIEAEDHSSVTINGATASGNGGSGISASTASASSVTINDATSSGNDTNGFAVDTDGGNLGTTVSLNRITASDNAGAGLSVRLRAEAKLAVTDAELRRNSPGLQLDEESYQGTLTVDRATVADNERIGGGGIYIAGADEVGITITDSTISGNRSLGDAGVSAHLGEDSSLSIVNSTISGNLADSDIAAIGVTIAPDSGASFTLAHSTVTDNESSSGGAVRIRGGGASIHDTIVAGNAPGTGVDLSFENVVGTIDYSLLGTLGPDAQTAAEAGTGNILGQPAGLGPLADNGGPTLTHLPLPTSPALNAGDPAISDPPATDQRGETRIVGTIDIGAVEAPARVPDLAATGFELSPALLGGAAALSLGMLLLAGAAWRRGSRYR